MNLAHLALLSLATYRTTRAITEDEIFRPFQEAVQNPVIPIPDKVRYLASCPHCLPPYVAAALLLGEHYAPRATRVLTTTLAAAAISTLITDYTLRKEKQNLPSFPASSPSPQPNVASQGTPPPLL